MTVIIILICVSVLVAGGFLFAFIWSVKSGQYDDIISPSVRILIENPIENKQQNNNNQTIKTTSK